METIKSLNGFQLIKFMKKDLINYQITQADVGVVKDYAPSADCKGWDLKRKVEQEFLQIANTGEAPKPATEIQSSVVDPSNLQVGDMIAYKCGTTKRWRFHRICQLSIDLICSTDEIGAATFWDYSTVAHNTRVGLFRIIRKNNIPKIVDEVVPHEPVSLNGLRDFKKSSPLQEMNLEVK